VFNEPLPKNVLLNPVVLLLRVGPCVLRALLSSGFTCHIIYVQSCFVLVLQSVIKFQILLLLFDDLLVTIFKLFCCVNWISFFVFFCILFSIVYSLVDVGDRHYSFIQIYKF
jgi:hypothetical protein